MPFLSLLQLFSPNPRFFSHHDGRRTGGRHEGMSLSTYFRKQITKHFHKRISANPEYSLKPHIDPLKTNIQGDPLSSLDL